jgi:plastocyanin
MSDPGKALVLAGCIVLAGALSSASSAEYTVGMAGWEFNPPELTIKVGDTVIWHNDDDTAHNIAFDIEFEDAPTMDKPQKVRMTENWTYTFDKAGVYKYTCKIHRNYDMNGVIVVKDQ